MKNNAKVIQRHLTKADEKCKCNSNSFILIRFFFLFMNYSSNFFLLLFTANSKGIRRVTVLHRALPDLDNSEGKI